MTLLQGIFLGIVQGLTEFLPVSSSGHLVFFQKVFHLEGDFLLFNLTMHLATVLAVLVVFRKIIWEIIKHPFGEMGRKIIISCIPTFILALIFKDLLENPSAIFLGCAFLLSAAILLIAQIVGKRNKIANPLGIKHSIIMGVAQGLACFPGISRSGSTISSGLISGADKNEVAEFSFLMSAPVIVGGFVFELFDVVSGAGSVSFAVLPTIVGFIFAFVSGLLAIKLMLNVVKKLNLAWFSGYLVIIAILTFIFLK